MRILIFAPHPDDEILGCGGTIAKYVSEGNDVYVCIGTCGHPPIYNDDLMKKEHWPHTLFPEIKQAHDILGVKETMFLDFPAADMESVKRYDLNGRIIEVVQSVKPEVIYMPHFGDMQKDHLLLAEAIMVAVRPKYLHKVRNVYAYETLSETEWNIPHASNCFIPTLFENISGFIDKKKDAMKCYKSQLGEFPDPRSIGAVEALAKLRGSTMNAGAAEAFMVIREYRY
ncbi:MAG: PIG-L family deacetylase [Clostridia bacterium]|nr:PIG-L family deacetylase [Clostridia bacterium]